VLNSITVPPSVLDILHGGLSRPSSFVWYTLRLLSEYGFIQLLCSAVGEKIFLATRTLLDFLTTVLAGDLYWTTVIIPEGVDTRVQTGTRFCFGVPLGVDAMTDVLLLFRTCRTAPHSKQIRSVEPGFPLVSDFDLV